jgi:osmoprotectant transport system permease protein
MNPNEPLVDWGWVFGHLDVIGLRLVEHIWLTVLAVGIGFLISFALSIWIARQRRVYAPVTAVSGLIYTIPSLALFAALIPITGLSTVTVEIALVGYTLLILVRNIVAGLDGVAPEIRESAEGMGYTSWQQLWRIELPLAIPVIVAGLRIATVSTIGLMTVAAIIGQGGLGVFILEGLNSFFPTKVYVGAVLSVMLAFAADLLFLRIQGRITPWSDTARASLRARSAT